MKTISTTRRGLIKAGLGASGGLVVGVNLSACGALSKRQIDAQGNWQADAWLEIKPDNTVVFTLDRVEMGQGTYTGITTLLAEELGVDPSAVSVVFAPAAKVYRNPDYGLQITGGSNSLSSSWQPIRQSGAAARMMLLAAASDAFQVPVNYLEAKDGRVVHPASGKSLPFGALTKLAANQAVPDEVVLTPKAQFKYIGKQNQRLDSELKVQGKANYGIDASVEGMRYAVVQRSPYIGGKVKSFDASDVLSMPGVEQVVEIKTGIAVVAKRYWQARKAVDALKIEWERADNEPKSSAQVMALYRERAAADDSDDIRREGKLDNTLARSAKTLELEFEVPFLAHATMEPMNCTAHVQKDRADIWTSTQGPDIAQVVVAKVTDLSLDEVHIHNQFIGGGFGRRLTQDFVGEAAEISYKAGGPIKLVWSREEDTKYDLYRPACLHQMRAGLDEQGKLIAWDHHIVCPKIMEWYIWDAAPAMFSWAPKFMYPMLGQSGLWTEGTPLTPADRSPYEGAEDLPYDIPALAVRHTRADAGVPVTYWRSVGHSHNAFVTECFIDELAEQAGQDSYSFRRDLLGKAPRLLAALDQAAKEGQWGRALPEGVFQGIAAHKSFGTYVAQLVELSVQNKQIKVHKVVCAVDCGTVVNPDIVTMQMESGIIYGLTAALYGEITIEDGQVQQSNFHDYPLLRMNESPEIQTIIIDSNETPTGVGEPGLPPLAPAMAQALYQATGKRLRSMPFVLG